jgi:hypothetical protein
MPHLNTHLFASRCIMFYTSITLCLDRPVDTLIHIDTRNSEIKNHYQIPITRLVSWGTFFPYCSSFWEIHIWPKCGSSEWLIIIIASRKSWKIWFSTKSIYLVMPTGVFGYFISNKVKCRCHFIARMAIKYFVFPPKSPLIGGVFYGCTSEIHG